MVLSASVTVLPVATPRRTQEERSSATRTRLLEATIECLVEFGYAGTTVARVSERAAVTRGAQVHHFPTKEQLVTSALRYLNERRSHEMIELLQRLEGSEDLVDRLLDAMWQLHRGPVFAATAEMWVAARSNPQLASHLGEVEEAATEELTAALKGNAAFRDAVFTSMDAMRGLVMSTWHLPEEDVQARWRRLKRHLRLTFPG